MLYRILFAILLISISPAQAQKTKAQLSTEISTTYPDNTTGAITPAGVRSYETDLLNSIMPTAPVTNNGFVCFNGTTGLLKDCGGGGALTATSLAVNGCTLGGSVFCVTGNGFFSGTEGVGTSTPQSKFHVNRNVTQNVTPFNAQGLAQFTQIDGQLPYIQCDGFGTSNGCALIGRLSGNTAGSPTAVASGSVLLELDGEGWDGSAWNTNGSDAYIILNSAQNFTTGQHGTYIALGTTPLNTAGGGNEAMRIDSTQFVGLNASVPLARLVVNGNTINVSATNVALNAGTPGGSSLQIIGADGQSAGLQFQTFQNGGFKYPQFLNRNARGTAASPTAVQSGDFLGLMGWEGYAGAAGWAGVNSAYIVAKATETYSSGHAGADLSIATVATGSANTIEAVHIYNDGGLAMSVANTAIASPGNGNIAATRYFSGTTGGLASKSCSITTATVATGVTLTITGGIVTGTTTC